MTEKTHCAVMSNHIQRDFPALAEFIKQNCSHKVFYRKGQTIPPLPPTQIMYLLQGSLKSYICNEHGDERLMYMLLEDSIVFGNIDDYFLKTLIVQDPAQILFIDHNAVLQFIQTDIAYIRQYIRICTSRYGVVLQQMLSINHCSAKYKVFSFILQLAQQYGIVDKEADVIIIKNFPSVTDIASITGVHRSNANSYITELKEQNVVSKNKNDFIIKDLALFKKIIAALDCKDL